MTEIDNLEKLIQQKEARLIEILDQLKQRYIILGGKKEDFARG